MKRFIIAVIIATLVFSLLNMGLVYFTSYTIDLSETSMPKVNRQANLDGSISEVDHLIEPPFIELEEVSPYLVKAIIAIEDHRFFNHQGIDFFRIFRVAIANIRSRNLVKAGASTITQQLSRNIFPFLSQERAVSRKITEAATALQVERTYSKNEILEMYLNIVFIGHGLHGVESAANLYFGKSASDLTLVESATIAGLLKGPGYYSPYVSREKALEHRNIVIMRMAELGYITEEKANQALDKPLITIRDLQGVSQYERSLTFLS